MRTALYARVSTSNRGQDTDLQLRELREFAKQRGWTVASEYVDEGVSGSKDSRPELNRLMFETALEQSTAFPKSLSIASQPLARADTSASLKRCCKAAFSSGVSAALTFGKPASAWQLGQSLAEAGTDSPQVAHITTTCTL